MRCESLGRWRLRFTSASRGARSQPRLTLPPKLVSVLPVFLVPRDEAPPTEDQKARVLRHLSWAQERYRELLRGADTFRWHCASPASLRANSVVRNTKPCLNAPALSLSASLGIRRG